MEIRYGSDKSDMSKTSVSFEIKYTTSVVLTTVFNNA